MPKNTWAGVVIGLLSIMFGFAFIWHIWWLVSTVFIGILTAWIAYSFQRSKDYYVEVSEVESIEDAQLQRIYQARPEYYQQHIKADRI